MRTRRCNGFPDVNGKEDGATNKGWEARPARCVFGGGAILLASIVRRATPRAVKRLRR